MSDSNSGAGHLSDEEIGALLRREVTPTTSLTHFLSCLWCQDRFRRRADPGLFAQLKPALEAGVDANDMELRNLVRQAYQETRRGQQTLNTYLFTGEIGGLRAVSPFILGTVVVRNADYLRHRHLGSLQELCEYIVSQIEESRQDEIDLKARLLAELGNCLRHRGDLLAARRFMLAALDLLDGVPDAITQGAVRWLAAVLFRDLQDSNRCRELCEQAARFFQAIEDSSGEGRIRYLEATLDFTEGRLDDAIGKLERLRSTPLDAITRLGVTHLITKILVLKGEYFRVPGLLGDLREALKEWTDSPAVIANTEWLQSLFLGGTGSPERAAKKLSEVVESFMEQNLPLEVALAQIDQAFFELKAGAHAKAAETASTALEVLANHQTVYPEAFAAIGVLVGAVRSDTLASIEFRALRLSLEQARHKPAAVQNGGPSGD